MNNFLGIQILKRIFEFQSFFEPGKLSEKLSLEIIEASAKLSEGFGNTRSISGTLKALQEQGTSRILKAGHQSSVKVDFI